MKRLLTLFALFISSISISQITAPPQGINYQAIAFDEEGEELVGEDDDEGHCIDNQDIRVRFSIIKDVATGTLTYREQHTTTTDDNGLFNLIIGQGTQDASPGIFSDIDWSTGFHFLKVEIDVEGGYQYTDMGTQQLWSVPYALYSKTCGNGISSVTDNGNGTLTFNYIDGSTYTTGVLSGLTGPQGINGQDGQSAYDLWLSQGNTGTESDFINAIQGAVGATGPAGQSAYQIWLSQGNTGTESDFLNSIQGAVGATGVEGQSAYQIWLSQGNTGTESDFLNSIQGAQGLPGTNGAVGATGPAGAAGPQGPIGLTGATGPQGATGLQGPIGLTGATGLQGPIGATGAQGIQGTPGSLNAWSLTGNSGTNAGTNFLGTTDNTDLLIKTNTTEKMRITSSGNVGVGTSSPPFKLTTIDDGIGVVMPFGILDVANNPRFRIDVEGDQTSTVSNVKFDVYPLDNISKAEFRFFRGTITTGPKYVTFFKGDGTNTGSAQIGIDGLNSYFQLQGGNFGIGTSNPTEKLEIENGGIRINGLYGIGFQDQPFNNTTPNGNEGAKIYFDNTIMADPNKDYLILEKKDGSSVNPDGGIVFANRGNNGIRTPTMIIDGFGNVGIGTTAPTARLDVSGTVKITDGTEGSGKVLTSDANGNASWQSASTGGSGALSNMSVYANSGSYTYTVPVNVTKIMVEVWGGGGGGGNNSTTASSGTSGGGGGGYGKEFFTVVPGTNYTVTVGAGGLGGTNNGAASSVGALISANGGLGGMSTGIPVLYATGGTSTAAFNIKGQTGQWASAALGGQGGDSFGGVGGRGAVNGAAAEPGIAPGGGGGGGVFQFAGFINGAAGAQGRVVISW